MTALWSNLQGVLGLWLVAAVCLTCVMGFVRSPAFKGWLGERMVRRWLAQDLDAQCYHCVHNVTLRLADGTTTQIDHVVVSRYGIFVLETKHMRGWIYGSAQQREWTQTIFKHRSRFQNPLRQNWRHIKALEEVLQLPLEQLHSGVVFTGDCTLKTAMPAHVTQGRECTSWIRSHATVLLSEAQVLQLVQRLSQRRLQPTRRTHQTHVAQLHARHSQKTLPAQPKKVVRVTPMSRTAPTKSELKMATPAAEREDPPRSSVEVTAAADPASCPECGEALVHRTVSNREGAPHYFWRCERFPHCRFVLPIALRTEDVPDPMSMAPP